jgi:hypothetical protein
MTAGRSDCPGADRRPGATAVTGTASGHGQDRRQEHPSHREEPKPHHASRAAQAKDWSLRSAAADVAATEPAGAWGTGHVSQPGDADAAAHGECLLSAVWMQLSAASVRTRGGMPTRLAATGMSGAHPIKAIAAASGANSGETRTGFSETGHSSIYRLAQQRASSDTWRTRSSALSRSLRRAGTQPWPSYLTRSSAMPCHPASGTRQD